MSFWWGHQWHMAVLTSGAAVKHIGVTAILNHLEWVTDCTWPLHTVLHYTLHWTQVWSCLRIMKAVKCKEVQRLLVQNRGPEPAVRSIPEDFSVFTSCRQRLKGSSWLYRFSAELNWWARPWSSSLIWVLPLLSKKPHWPEGLFYSSHIRWTPML